MAAALALVAATACTDGRSAAVATAPQAPAMIDVAEGAEAAPAEHVHGKGKGKFGESVVYVDGQPRAVLRYSELPSSIVPHAMQHIDRLDIPRYFRLVDYVTALGVDLRKIRAIQFFGSHARVATLEGEEILRFKDDLVFDFTQQVRGKPRARWSIPTLKSPTYIDVIMAMTIYVDKAAPKYTPHTGALAFEDGKPIEGIPYATEDAPKGTRVYVDGVLQGWVKRKLLTDKMIADGDGRSAAQPGLHQTDRVFPKFSFSAFIDSLGVDSKRAKAIDFYAGDDLATRVSAKDWQKDKGTFVFTTPRHAHGKVNAIFSADKSAQISAVELYIRTAPPVRTPEPDVFDQQAGSDENQNAKSNVEIAGKSSAGDSAHTVNRDTDTTDDE